MEKSGHDFEGVAAVLEEHRERLTRFITLKMNPVMLRRLTVEDVLQEVYLAAHKRIEFWEKDADIPPFVRLRTLTLQTLADLQRKHLGAQKRDAHREIGLEEPRGSSNNEGFCKWLADSITSPRSKMANAERALLVREIVDTLADNDRAVLSLRHFEELTNQETASVLGIEPKAASIRYFRALKRLQEKLVEITEFRP